MFFFFFLLTFLFYTLLLSFYRFISNRFIERGKNNLIAASNDLLKVRGLVNATDVIITGCSAGGIYFIYNLLIFLNIYFVILGLSTYIHTDFWRSIIPETAKVRGVGDAGWFLDTNSVSGLFLLMFFFFFSFLFLIFFFLVLY